MNRILNNKINSDLKQIIGSYNLHIENKKNIVYLENLIYKTRYIKYCLITNTCIDNKYNQYNNLNGSKLRNINLIYGNYFWTIRKCF